MRCRCAPPTPRATAIGRSRGPRTTATSAPGAPTGLTATASGDHPDRPLLERPGSTGGSAITGYKIEVSPNGTSGWTDQVANTNSTATTYGACLRRHPPLPRLRHQRQRRRHRLQRTAPTLQVPGRQLWPRRSLPLPRDGCKSPRSRQRQVALTSATEEMSIGACWKPRDAPSHLRRHRRPPTSVRRSGACLNADGSGPVVLRPPRVTVPKGLCQPPADPGETSAPASFRLRSSRGRRHGVALLSTAAS